MTKARLEAFSDGVIAILITIMVLELKVPLRADASALIPLWPVFLSYVLSFIFIGIYWNNHHHLMQTVRIVNGRVLWANTHLLFWLSLIPFVTAWMGENHFAPAPVALYGVNLFCASFAYYVLTQVLLAVHDKNSALARAVESGAKEKISIVIYILGIVSASRFPVMACGLYGVVSVIWLVPDRRIEKILLESVGERA